MSLILALIAAVLTLFVLFAQVDDPAKLIAWAVLILAVAVAVGGALPAWPRR